MSLASNQFKACTNSKCQCIGMTLRSPTSSAFSRHRYAFKGHAKRNMALQPQRHFALELGWQTGSFEDVRTFLVACKCLLTTSSYRCCDQTTSIHVRLYKRHAQDCSFDADNLLQILRAKGVEHKMNKFCRTSA